MLVVDEAGMAARAQLAALLDAASCDAKLVLVGDPRQLPEIEAGGAFLGLVQRGGDRAARQRRQLHEWEREALDQLRDGESEPRSTILAHAASSSSRRRRNRAPLVDDWWDGAATPGAR